MLAATFLVTGCAGTEISTGSASAVGAAARDYGTLAQRTPRASLLTLEEIRPFLVLGFDIRTQPLLDPKVLDLTTLHGPCGADVPTPFAPTKGFVVFRSTETLTVEAIAEPGSAAARAFVDTLAADAKDGCPAFSETLGNATSKVTYVEAIPMLDVGQHRVGWEQTLSGASGYSHRFVMVVSGGGRVLLLVVLSNDPLIAENLNPVLKRAFSGA
jgi:hypothetical protein